MVIKTHQKVWESLTIVQWHTYINISQKDTSTSHGIFMTLVAGSVLWMENEGFTPITSFSNKDILPFVKYNMLILIMGYMMHKTTFGASGLIMKAIKLLIESPLLLYGMINWWLWYTKYFMTVTELFLLEDGETIEVTTLMRKRTFHIKDVEPWDEESYTKLNPHFAKKQDANHFLPFQWKIYPSGNYIFWLDRNSHFYYPDVLEAIMTTKGADSSYQPVQNSSGEYVKPQEGDFTGYSKINVNSNTIVVDAQGETEKV